MRTSNKVILIPKNEHFNIMSNHKKLKLKETLANKPIVDVKWNKETTYKMSGKIKNKSNVE